MDIINVQIRHHNPEQFPEFPGFSPLPQRFGRGPHGTGWMGSQEIKAGCMTHRVSLLGPQQIFRRKKETFVVSGMEI